jgi:hypothetical protein
VPEYPEQRATGRACVFELVAIKDDHVPIVGQAPCTMYFSTG